MYVSLPTLGGYGIHPVGRTPVRHLEFLHFRAFHWLRLAPMTGDWPGRQSGVSTLGRLNPHPLPTRHKRLALPQPQPRI